MAINPATVARLVQVAADAAAAPSGGKAGIYAATCLELGISLPTLHRHLKKVCVKPNRKQRSDAGDVLLSRDDAIALSAVLMSSQRKTGKRLLAIGPAVDMLRANGEIKAECLDAETGELKRLSDSAIARALRHYGLHPDMLNRPTPAVELKSLHPNHVWQIDASLCVLYYLNPSSSKDAGLQVMDRTVFYKNKPANLKRIEADRVWSYEVTDHNSGAIFVNYVMGAESSANLADSFIKATQKREGDPMHGVPNILMMDMGSANTSGLFANLARRLQVELIAHSPGNARATGQVENARNLIETSFESGLRLMPVANLDELNHQAQRWARWYNGNKIHSRHGKTRYDQWLTIREEQLRIAPPAELCYELLTATPELRQVTDKLRVQFKGREFDVRDVPNVMIGEKLQVTRNPYQLDAALVLLKGADGHELLHTAPLVAKDDAGFSEHANVIGEDYGRPADTVLDTNRKLVERFTYDAATDEEAVAKRKAGATPLASRIDPFKVIDQTPLPAYLPKRGAELVPAVTTSRTAAAERVLTIFETASALVNAGMVMTRERRQQVAAWYPDGMPEGELDALQARLTVRAGLRMVAGGGD
jgi:transposase InsO family protein